MQGCRPLTPEEVDEILVSFGGRFADRDKALFVMGVYTGFRITELLSLRLRDVHQFGKVVPRVTISRGIMKGKRASRTVALHPFAQALLAECMRDSGLFSPSRLSTTWSAMAS